MLLFQNSHCTMAAETVVLSLLNEPRMQRHNSMRNPAPESYVEMTGRVSYLAVEGHAFECHHLIMTRVEKFKDGKR